MAQKTEKNREQPTDILIEIGKPLAERGWTENRTAILYSDETGQCYREYEAEWMQAFLDQPKLIEALVQACEERDWIPVTDDLPDHAGLGLSEEVNVLLSNGKVKRGCWDFDTEEWADGLNGNKEQVIMWRR